KKLLCGRVTRRTEDRESRRAVFGGKRGNGHERILAELIVTNSYLRLVIRPDCDGSKSIEDVAGQLYRTRTIHGHVERGISGGAQSADIAVADRQGPRKTRGGANLEAVPVDGAVIAGRSHIAGILRSGQHDVGAEAEHRPG